MNEIIARCAGAFVPKSAADFIGRNVIERANGSQQCGAYLIAQHLEKAVRLAKASGNAPIKLLLTGEPGLGKSALVLYLQHLLGCDKWTTNKLNGTQLKVDAMDEIAAQFHYKSLFGDYRMLWVEEADEWPRVAQVRSLTLLDDMPAGSAIVCTSNARVKNFEDRFQSRFQVFEVCAPPPEEISQFIVRLAPNVPMTEACHIANFACGNVRQALLDAQGILQQAA